jgi:hypothetical protein
MQSGVTVNSNDLFLYELSVLKNSKKNLSYSLIRPYLLKNSKKIVSMGFKSHNYYNDGFTNLDNNSEIIAYHNISNYNEYYFMIYNKFLYLRFNPVQRITSEKNNKSERLESTYNYLNDRQGLINTHDSFLYQSSLALHYKGLAIGISNESDWFGPGFHSSLIMSNNSAGFNHYFIGTLEQLRFRNFGINFKYLVYENNETDIPFFHSVLSGSMSFYNHQVISIGFSRSYFSRQLDKLSWSIEDAARLVFEPLFSKEKDNNYGNLFPGEPENWEPWDQTLSAYFNIYFPKSKLFTYFEIGTDDSRANYTDLRAHWDHNIGYVIGFRKYEIFNNENLFLGVEYISTKNSTNTHKSSYYRGGITDPNYYTNNKYLYSTYGGRRIGAHSGSDSDDLILLLGYSQKSLSLIYKLNIERHGVSVNGIPEYKRENSIEIRYQYSLLTYSIYFERDKIYNYNFKLNDKEKISNIIGLSINLIIY